jgi:hypothetical protein
LWIADFCVSGRFDFPQTPLCVTNWLHDWKEIAMRLTTAEEQEMTGPNRPLAIRNPALGAAPEGAKSAIRNSGTALIEFVMTIPFLAVVISLTFFFGWSLKNQQEVKVSDRYLAWSDTTRGGAPSATDINVAFFETKAVNVRTDYNNSPSASTDTLNDMVSKAGQVARPVAQYMADNSPHACSVSVGADFPPPTSTPWKQFTGQMTGDYAREGVEWRHTQASCEPAIINQYLDPMDRMFVNMQGPASSLAGIFRGLYNSSWQ